MKPKKSKNKKNNKQKNKNNNKKNSNKKSKKKKKFTFHIKQILEIFLLLSSVHGLFYYFRIQTVATHHNPSQFFRLLTILCLPRGLVPLPKQARKSRDQFVITNSGQDSEFYYTYVTRNSLVCARHSLVCTINSLVCTRNSLVRTFLQKKSLLFFKKEFDLYVCIRKSLDCTFV